MTTKIENDSTINPTKFRPILSFDKNTKSINTKKSFNVSNINHVVETFLEDSKNDIPVDNTDDLPEDDPYFSSDHTWEQSFEDTYSPYNTDDYQSDNNSDEEVTEFELGCETIRW